MSHQRNGRVRVVVFLGCLGMLFSLGGSATNARADEIRWVNDFSAAKRLSVESGRPLLLHFWAPWCAPCMQMKQTTFNDPNVARLLHDHFVPVSLNYDHPTSKQLATQYGIQGVPSDVILAPDGRILARSPQALGAQHYTMMLTQAMENARMLQVAQSPQVSAMPVGNTMPNMATNMTPGVTPNMTPPNPAGYTPGSTAPYAPNAYGTGSVQPPQGQPNQVVPPQGQPNNMSNNMPPQGQYGSVVPGNPPFGVQPPLMGAAPVQPPYASPSAPAASEARSQPFGLEGYCPVELVDGERWVAGNTQYGAVHQDVTYLFAGPEQQKKFMANPDRYAPANRGFDIVLSTETGQNIPGKRQHGVFLVDGKKNQRTIYLFSSEATLQKFQGQMKATADQAAMSSNTQPSQPATPPPAQAEPEQAKKPWWFR